MEGTGGSEPTGQMLSRRLAESVGSHSRIDERSVAEEAELLDCLHRESLTVEIPTSLPDFIGSEHEVWSDGETVTKATLPGSYGRLWGERRFALPSEYLRRIDLSNTIFAIRWEVVGLTLELNRVRIVSQQPFFKGEAPTLSEIAEFMRSDDALASNFYDEWISSGGNPPRANECVGYKVPLFLGGSDTVENLELADLDVFWTICGQLRNSGTS